MRVPRIMVIALVLLLASCTGADRGDGATGAGARASATPTPQASRAAVASPPATNGAVQPSEGLDTADLTLTDGNERVVVSVWVADSDQQRQRGLMGRASMAADAGMLFVFDQSTSGGFWMKNTLIPLSIAFADGNGRVVDILDMEPCEADPCTVYNPDADYRYALEVNRGFFEDHGITEDWTLDMADVPGAS